MWGSDSGGCYIGWWVLLMEVGLVVLVVVLVVVVGSVASVCDEGFAGWGSAVALVRRWVLIRARRWIHGWVGLL